jgi:hypothetical protein
LSRGHSPEISIPFRKENPMKNLLLSSTFALSLCVLGCTTAPVSTSHFGFNKGLLPTTQAARSVGFSRVQPTSAISQRTWLCDNQQDNSREILTLKECKILIDNSVSSLDGRRVVDIHALKKNRRAWAGLSTGAIEAIGEYETITVGGPQ